MQNRGLGGDVRFKSGERLLLFLLLEEYRKRRPGLDRQSTIEIYCHKRDTNLSWSWIRVVYHVLRRYTRGDSGVYLHRAGPGAMGHSRLFKGYARASKWYYEKQRGTVLGSKMISLVLCHMTYKPPQVDSPES